MAGIQGKRFNWRPQPSAWQDLQNRRERSKEFREKYASANADAHSKLTAVWSSQVTSGGDLAAKKALTRIQAEAAAKIQENQREEESKSFSVWKNAAPPKQVTAGDSKIDMVNNTLTLSDGTLIDIKTGVKKVNMMT
jgi:hypothetical protein